MTLSSTTSSNIQAMRVATTNPQTKVEGGINKINADSACIGNKAYVDSGTSITNNEHVGIACCEPYGHC